MATDYDALRVPDRDDADPTADYLARLDTRKAAASAATLVLDDDVGPRSDGPTLDYGTDTDYLDLDGSEFAGIVVPQQRYEFVCVRCFLVQHRSRRARAGEHGPICRDCA